MSVIGETAQIEILMIGRIVVSVGTAVMLVHWGALLSEYGSNASGVMAAGSFVLGCMIYLIFAAVPVGRIARFATTGLLAVCGCSLILAQKKHPPKLSAQPDPPSSKRPEASLFNPFPKRMIKTFACLAVCVLLNEVIRIASTPLVAEKFSSVGVLTQTGGLAVATVALIVLALSKKELNFSAMSRFLLPIMIAGFLSFLVFDREDTSLMFVLLGTGYWCLQLLILIALCKAVDRLHLPAIRTFALFYGAMQVAILAAKPFGRVAIDMLAGMSSGLSLIVSAAVLIVVVLAMLLLRGDDTDMALWVDADDIGVQADRFGSAWLCAIADEFGLSPRETEVFVLLARGRSLPIIKNELSIATGTAQTHIRHIYEKLGIHTRQELFDLIESRLGRRAE